jgi:hypothetical protein
VAQATRAEPTQAVTARPEPTQAERTRAEATRAETAGADAIKAGKSDPHITEQRTRPMSAQAQPNTGARPAAARPADGAEAADKAKWTGVDADKAEANQVDADKAEPDKAERDKAEVGKAEADKDDKGKRKPDGSLSRLAAYKAEVAELLGGDSAARRRRKNVTASGLPAPDPATQEPPIKVTRPPRKGGSRSKD